MEYGGFGILSFIYTRSRSRPTGSVDTSCRSVIESHRNRLSAACITTVARKRRLIALMT
jgi:hypothetical protein